MKIQYNACEAAEARVLCCADEAALCWACDEKVHAANRLAGKHPRVPLTSSSSSSSFPSTSYRLPHCDICQDATGYFFCLEDRALLCRECDVALHRANTYVSSHQRFLLTGAKVGPEPTEPAVSFAKEHHSKSLLKRSPSVSLSGEDNKTVSSQAGKNVGLPARKPTDSGGKVIGSSAELAFGSVWNRFQR